MKQTIWKFELKMEDEQVIKIPKSSQILTIQTQNDNPRIWALVYPHMPMEEKIIEIFGTGHFMEQDVDNRRSYLGTFQIDGGRLVFHVFERHS